MLEALTGTGLAAAAGLNAYIPLLMLGLASRFLDVVALPNGWAWLENEWVLGGLGVLLVIEMVADKIPAVDTINDWLQTVVRPASGGIVFGTGSASQTVAVPDPAAFFESVEWGPVVSGMLIALGVHAAKSAARPVLNAMTLGVAAPVVSTIEDGSSMLLAVLAIVAPVLVIAALGGIGIVAVLLYRRLRARRAAASAPRT
jgi:hypothetical protein